MTKRAASARLVSAAFCAALAIGARGAEALEVTSAVLRVDEGDLLPISRLELPAEDSGFAGGRVATDDNMSTGRFLGHTFETLEAEATPADAAATLDELIAQGAAFVAVVAGAETLLALADHAEGRDVLLFNASAPDDRLRDGDCRANVFHIAPSRAMKADALAQYLVWKKWDEWLLVHGTGEADRLMADAHARAAKKFGAEVVERLAYEGDPLARRSDTGYVLIQKQIPGFTQRAEAHDVVVVADESEVFGTYMPYRVASPRPVAGDAGLEPMSWHPAFEAYGGTQMQRRFERSAGRAMTPVDYNVWLALRSIGEAVTRTSAAEPAAVRDYLRSEEFEIAAFKGQPLTFRTWNQQMRQPVILADGLNAVSVSPQEEFLHQRSRLDTLGLDEPESSCDLD